MHQQAFYHMQDFRQVTRSWRIELTENELWLGITAVFAAGFILGLACGILAMAAL